MTGNPHFDMSNTLKWDDTLGIGFLPGSSTSIYDENYFDNYIKMSKTNMGDRINNERIGLVNTYFIDDSNDIVDVGVGALQFVNSKKCKGFDINPVATNILITTQRWLNPYENRIKVGTFWDSLEHIPDVHLVLENITNLVFVSIPIFKDYNHVITSKHYKPGEHCWYFTDAGFKWFMNQHGFEVIIQNKMETILGRQDIGTYVCKRVS